MRALKSRLLPALGGPTRTTRGCPSGRSRPWSRAARAATSTADPARSSARAARPRRSTSGSSAKSRLASRWARTSSRRSRSAMIGPARPPASCSRAASSCAGDLASITPSTASARVRSIRPVRKARSVNSPGSASLAPRVRQWASSRSSSGGEPTVWISTSGPPGVRPRARPERDRGGEHRPEAVHRQPAGPTLGAAGRWRIAIGHEARQGDPPGLRAGQADEAAESRAGRAGHRRDRVGRVEVTHRRRDPVLDRRPHGRMPRRGG